MQQRGLPYLSLFFWLVPLISLVAVWDSLPRASTQLALAIAALMVGLTASNRQVSYPLIGTPFFILLAANYYQAFLLLNPLLISLVVLVGIPTSGLGVRKLERLSIEKEDVINWLILGFLTAQVNSLLLFWPFSFLENTLVSFIVFYALFQLIGLFSNPVRRSIIAHFVFTLLAVILVIGVLLWANFPQLRTF